MNDQSLIEIHFTKEQIAEIADSYGLQMTDQQIEQFILQNKNYFISMMTINGITFLYETIQTFLKLNK